MQNSSTPSTKHAISRNTNHAQLPKRSAPYRGLLTLNAAAVEPERRHAVRVALDVEDALVVLLARLRLRKVLGQQSDGPHHTGRDIDLCGGQDLRTLLQDEKNVIKETET